MKIELVVASVIPFLLFGGLMLWRKISLMGVSLAVGLCTVILASVFWKTEALVFANSLVRGGFVGFDILLIVFGAVFFLGVLREIGVIERVSVFLESVSGDLRIKVILLAWFLVNFLEGVAGFGTPGAVVAPILLSLGISPVTAVILSLLGNSSAGVFGAVGTPIRVGLAGLETGSVPFWASVFNFAGVVMPIVMMTVLRKEQKKSWRYFAEILPFALWSGLLFAMSNMLMVYLGIGYEYVSIAGSLLAMAGAIVSVRAGFLVPRKSEIKKQERSLKFWQTFGPYVWVLLMFGLTRRLLPAVSINFPWGYTYLLNLFNPGWSFVAVGMVYGLRKLGLAKVKQLFGQAIRRVGEPFVVIMSMSVAISVMTNTGREGLPSMIMVLSSLVGKDWLEVLTPLAGALGSMLTGSITISSLLFGKVFQETASLAGVDVGKVLGLLISGAAIGNSVAVADIMASEAVLGLKNKTREVIRGTAVGVIGALGVMMVLAAVLFN